MNERSDEKKEVAQSLSTIFFPGSPSCSSFCSVVVDITLLHNNLILRPEKTQGMTLPRMG